MWTLSLKSLIKLRIQRRKMRSLILRLRLYADDLLLLSLVLILSTLLMMNLKRFFFFCLHSTFSTTLSRKLVMSLLLIGCWLVTVRFWSWRNNLSNFNMYSDHFIHSLSWMMQRKLKPFVSSVLTVSFLTNSHLSC